MSRSRPAALFFDLDGTLVDSVADLAAALNHVRERHGAEAHSEDMVRSFVGDGAWRLVQRGVADLALPVDAALAEFRSFYGTHCLDRTVPYPGITELLQRLPSDMRCAVVSNKPQLFCERIVEGLGWQARFGAVVGVHDKLAAKPAPDLLELAARQLDVELPQVWMIGDSPNDLRAARAVGALAVAVGWGLVDAAILRAEAPDLWLDEAVELLAHLG